MIALLLAACAKPPPPTSAVRPAPPATNAANRTACVAYVEAFDALPCLAVHLDPKDICPTSLDQVPCDMSAYYACMGAAAACRGEFLDVSGQVDCAMPACP